MHWLPLMFLVVTEVHRSSVMLMGFSMCLLVFPLMSIGFPIDAHCFSPIDVHWCAPMFSGCVPSSWVIIDVHWPPLMFIVLIDVHLFSLMPIGFSCPLLVCPWLFIGLCSLVFN